MYCYGIVGCNKLAFEKGLDLDVVRLQVAYFRHKAVIYDTHCSEDWQHDIIGSSIP